MCSAPTRSPYNPAFFAKLCTNTSSSITIVHNKSLTWHTNNGSPCSIKYLTAHASLSKSPLANPWYAQSKNEKCFLAEITSAIAFHCSGVGSTPVGLCAHACSKITERSGAFLSASVKPWKSSPTVVGS